MRLQSIIEGSRFGKKPLKKKTKTDVLYHLCDYHGYSYSIDNDALRSLRGSYVSTTNDPSMNSVGGRSHYDFKMVLDGQKLAESYELFEYTDYFYFTGSRKRNAYNEREIGVETKSIEPLSTYLKGTILRFNLFSEKGIQWLLYKPSAYKGLFDNAKGEAPHAITTLYKQIFEWRKPVWVAETGQLLTKKEMAFLRDAHAIISQGGDFKTGFEELAKTYPIVSHDGEPLTNTDVQRMFLAPKLVDMLNAYYENRKRKDIKPEQVSSLLSTIISAIGLGNNATSVIMGAIEGSGLLHPATEPVTWGGIIRDAMSGDIDKTLDTIKWFGERNRRNREWYDETDLFQNSVHYATSFGRS